MSSIVVFFCMWLASSQLTAVDSNLTLNISHHNTLSMLPSFSSSYASLQSIEYANTYLYTLASNNNVQIYSRSNPSMLIKNYTTYDPATYSTINFIHLSVNPTQTVLCLTSYYNFTMKHLVFSIGFNASLTYQNITNSISNFYQPSKVFMNGQNIFAYFKSSSNQDWIQINNFATNTSKRINLTVSYCNIQVAPNIQKAVVWDIFSRIHIYSIDQNFTLQYTYNGSVTNVSQITNYIHFSSDSQHIIIETDYINSLKIFNVYSFTQTRSVYFWTGIYNAYFIDSNSRFILIQSTYNQFFIYDLLKSTNWLKINGSMPYTNLKIDQNKGVLYHLKRSTVQCYAISLIENNIILSAFGGLHNTTNSNSSFYISLNYTEFQNISLFYMGRTIQILDEAIQKSFSMIFSSPLASFFLGIFSYFTLSSIYVLIPIQVPQIVFNYLSLTFIACQSNFIEEFQIFPTLAPLTNERVTDQRSLYFNISSDIVSKNYLDFGIILGNIMLVELCIFIVGKKCLNVKKIHSFIVKQRLDLYWGLIVSNMIYVILPWKNIIKGGFYNFTSKMNIMTYYLVYMVLFFMIVASFLGELRAAKKSRYRKNYVKVAVRKWWTTYENFIYPFLVLIDNPIYFFVVIGLSQLFYLYNSFSVPKYKIFAIMKACYPIIIHITFIIFYLQNDQAILSLSSIICLSTFLLGACHHIIEALVESIRSVWKVLKKSCQSEDQKEINQKSISLKKNKQKQLSKKKKYKSGSKSKSKGKKVKIQEIIQKVNDEILNDCNIKKKRHSPPNNINQVQFSDIKIQNNIKKIQDKPNYYQYVKTSRSISIDIKKQVVRPQKQCKYEKKQEIKIKKTKDKQGPSNLEVLQRPTLRARKFEDL